MGLKLFDIIASTDLIDHSHKKIFLDNQHLRANFQIISFLISKNSVKHKLNHNSVEHSVQRTSIVARPHLPCVGMPDTTDSGYAVEKTGLWVDSELCVYLSSKLTILPNL